jgi:5-methylcytosine-specific restriction endonuclease McrA
MNKKKCPKCSRDLSLKCFSIRPNGNPQSWCVKCTSKYIRTNYKEKYAKWNHDYYLKNKNRILDRNKEWLRNNPEKKKLQGHRYNKSHPEIFQIKNSRRRSHLINSTGKFTLKEFCEIKKLYRNKCLCCGKSETEIKLTPDHIVPISKGGSNLIENIQPLCEKCNKSKRDKFIDYRKVA